MAYELVEGFLKTKSCRVKLRLPFSFAVRVKRIRTNFLPCCRGNAVKYFEAVLIVQSYSWQECPTVGCTCRVWQLEPKRTCVEDFLAENTLVQRIEFGG